MNPSSAFSFLQPKKLIDLITSPNNTVIPNQTQIQDPQTQRDMPIVTRVFQFLQPRRLYDQIPSLNNTFKPNQTQIQNLQTQCDVFINHRGPDTKLNIAALLHGSLQKYNIHAFLDFKTMEPGDKITDTIDSAIRRCKIGAVLFSPGYCGSRYCHEELALLVEMKKVLIPIFCDVEVDHLQIMDDGNGDVERFRDALAVAKNTAGIRFDTKEGNWQNLIEEALDAIEKKLSGVKKSRTCTCGTFGVRRVVNVLHYKIASLITISQRICPDAKEGEIV